MTLHSAPTSSVGLEDVIMFQVSVLYNFPSPRGGREPESKLNLYDNYCFSFLLLSCMASFGIVHKDLARAHVTVICILERIGMDKKCNLKMG